MARFDYISGDDFRASLESDYQELKAAMAASAWKAAHVLSGSIVEALLVDYLISTNYQQKDPLKMTLEELISACKAASILSPATAELASVIRSYRNLIHPGRIVRLGEVVDENRATVASALVEIIIDDITKSRGESYGYTAEQIVSKLISDTSAITILGYLLKHVNAHETRRLLLDVLPTKYLALKQDPEYEHAVPVFRVLRHCFREVFRLAPKQVKEAIGRRFATIIKEETQYFIRTYEQTFFRGRDIEFYLPEDAELIKAHLLGLMERSLQPELIEIISGIGASLSPDEAIRFSRALMGAIISDRELRKSAAECLTIAYDHLPQKAQTYIINRFNTAIEDAKTKGFDSLAAELLTSQEMVESGIPF